MSVAPDQLRAWLAIAEEAAQRAGEYLTQARVSKAIVTAELKRDVKLEVDQQSEELILRVLTEKSSFAVLTEERGLIEARSEYPNLKWIVDPLDGSLNYLRGIPLCCISIGLWDRDEPLLGVVYDFGHGEMFTGIVGIGAWLNGVSIQVGDVSEWERAILCTGFPVSTDFSSKSLAGFVEQVRQYKKVRLLGSAALSLAYVAASRVDAYYERDIRLWDVASGLAIVQAAGGVVVRAASSIAGTVTVYAGNSLLSWPHPTQTSHP